MKQLIEITELLQETFRMPAALIGKDHTVSHASKEFECNCLHLFEFEAESSLPQIRTTPFEENYIGIPIREELGAEGMLLLGPSVYMEVTEKAVKQRGNGLSVKEIERLVAYYRSYPVIPFEKLNHIAVLAYYMLYGTRIQVEELIEYNFYCVQAMHSAYDKYAYILSTGRQDQMPHPSYEREKRLFDCIKRGDSKQLLKELNQPIDGTVGVLSLHDPLRSMKNAVITFAGLGCRTIIESGIPGEVGYALNDAFAQLIEESTTIENVNAIMVTMLCEYANIVREYSENAYSKAVKSCLDYIYAHLYEEISLQEMSRQIHFHPNYLSRIFKAETGKTISEFINYEKVEEAKKLLVYTDYTIIDIVTLLHFHDQSHFTRVFKRMAGVTPKRYREQY